MLQKSCVKTPANTARTALVVSTGATGPMNSEQSSVILYINSSVGYLIRHDFEYPGHVWSTITPKRLICGDMISSITDAPHGESPHIFSQSKIDTS